MLELTDKEAMLLRFSHKNIKKSTGTIAQVLGCTTKEFEEAVRRGMEQEAKELREAKKQYWTATMM